MRRNSWLAVAALGAGLVAVSCAGPARTGGASLEDILSSKQDVTILVTDSGLGGLSVAADLARRLPESGVFRKVRVVFYNALFSSIGYNDLTSEAEKDRVFDVVLAAMDERYHPDLLLIACNTLSVVYPRTAFARHPRFPVIGIVETGVDLIAKQFDKTPEATALVFGTLTTIQSEAHKKALVSRGFPADRIVGEACPRLAGAIERGTTSEETVGYIKQFVAEALAKAPRTDGPVFVSLNCTHFGYARQQFADAFAAAGHPGIEILDPNPLMADAVLKAPYLHRHAKTEVGVEVVSKVEITEQERASIGPLLESVSPSVAKAFRSYTFDPHLFEVTVEAPKPK